MLIGIQSYREVPIMAFCSKCGTPIDDDQEYCESCNPNKVEEPSRFDESPSTSPATFLKVHLWHIIAGVLVVALIVMAILYLTKPTDNSSHPTDDSNISELEGKVTALTDQLKAARDYSYKLSQDIAEAKSEYASLSTEYETLTKELDKYEDTDAEYWEMYGDYAVIKARADSLERDLKNKASSISQLESDYENLTKEYETFKAASVTYLEKELKQMRTPKPFESMEELERWLYYDDTDYAYNRDTPLNRGFILHMRLLREGYFVSFLVENDTATNQTTGRNYVYVKNEGVYYINANNDAVVSYWPNQSLDGYYNEPDTWVYYSID